MAINKVIANDTVLIDLTSDTITENVLREGFTAHDKTGTQITGTMKVSTIYQGLNEPSDYVGEEGDIYLMGVGV